MSEPFSFDFNGATKRKSKRRSVVPDPLIRAAASKLAGQKKATVKLLQELNHARALLGSDRSITSPANQVALRAVAAYLSAGGDDPTRCGRVFELLADNIAGVGDERLHRAKGATAFLVEYLAALPGQARQVERHALDAAYVLSERGFPFSGKNASGENERGVSRKLKNPLVVARMATITLWRRRYRSKGGASDPAAAIFKALAKKPPFKATGNAAEKARTAIAWWYELLADNDF